MKEDWENFKATHGKTYSNFDEEVNRMRVFKANNEMIIAHNADETQTYKKAMNKFGDYTEEEFTTMYRNLNISAKQANEVKIFDTEALPTTVDWNKAGAVTPVKD